MHKTSLWNIFKWILKIRTKLKHKWKASKDWTWKKNAEWWVEAEAGLLVRNAGEAGQQRNTVGRIIPHVSGASDCPVYVRPALLIYTQLSEGTSHLLWNWSQAEFSWKEGEALSQIKICASMACRCLVGVSPLGKQPQGLTGEWEPHLAGLCPSPNHNIGNKVHIRWAVTQKL